MKPEQITAIAREYVKENGYGLQVNPHVIEESFRWLSQRYCLVEKGAVCKEYRNATTHVAEAIKSKNPLSESCGKGRRLAIQSLFPEIAKEVEDVRI